MRSLLSILLLLVLSASCKDTGSQPVLVSSDEMKELMAIDSLQLIDVRALEAFQEGHLKGAQNLIYDEDFDKKIKLLDKNKPVAVYCRTGRRSKKCTAILKEAGFKQIYQLKGGLSQWEYTNELIRDTINNQHL